MTFLLDTNAFSDLMRRHPKAMARLHALSSQDRVAICPIVRGEILYGLGRLAHRQRRAELETKASELFQAMVCELVGSSLGDHYAAAKLHCEREGLPVDDNDLWIAASAMSLGAVLITRDAALRRIPDMQIQDWTT